MFEEIITGPSSIPFIFFVILQPQFFYGLLKEENITLNWSFYSQILFATLLVVLTLTFYVSLIVIPSKMKETINVEYETLNISER